MNEQLVLTCMHTLMAREHNRLAKTLAVVNPHWDDETLFQEARRIVIAEIQHITYNEFLPILLGKDVMEKFGLLVETQVCVCVCVCAFLSETPDDPVYENGRFLLAALAST